MDQQFEKLKSTELIWLPEKGIGYYPVKEKPYDRAYFEKYKMYAQTEMGKKLTQARLDFVHRNFNGSLVDVGIGSGQFLESRLDLRKITYGYDINPYGVKWLKDNYVYFDPTNEHIEGATFWDSLEHIQDPCSILNNILEWFFVSLPIFIGVDHILKSKHFRKTEHCWYYTAEGFVNWVYNNGFELKDHSLFETKLGREDIQTFAFKRAK